MTDHHHLFLKGDGETMPSGQQKFAGFWLLYMLQVKIKFSLKIFNQGRFSIPFFS